MALLTLAELERSDPALQAVKPTRTTLEYYWTLTPGYLLHLLQRRGQIELLTYLDADVYFYADPTPLFEEIGGGSMLAVRSRYTPFTAAQSSGTRFQVVMNMFRRTEEAIACLEHWREQCLEWCYERFEDGPLNGRRFGDQGYLDQWPDRYPGFVASQHLGAGLAPWNLANHELSAPDGRPLVDGVPLIYFHFGRLRIVRSWLFEPTFWLRQVPMTSPTKHALCVPYARALRRAIRQARAVSDDIPSRDLLPRRMWQLSLRQMLLHRSFLIVTDSFAI
jgi:hypothetical protein